MTDFVDTSRPQTAKDHTRRNKAIQEGGRGSEANIGHVPTAGLFSSTSKPSPTLFLAYIKQGTHLDPRRNQGIA